VNPDADLRICLSEVSEDIQLPVQADDSGSSAGLSQMRQQEDGKATQPLCHDAPID
jgi:hypothetical protein